MKYEKIKAGDVLYDVHSYRMGNTTIRSMGVWQVKVITLHPEDRTATVSWNGNRPERYYASDLKRLREKEPTLIKTGFFGQRRLARRGEKVTP